MAGFSHLPASWNNHAYPLLRPRRRGPDHQSVTLCGWADVACNLGGVCFIDLRDHEGIVQVLVEPDNAAVFAIAEQVGYEDALQVTGTVRARHAVNERIRTGRVEVVASAIRIVNKARPLPFHAHENPGEDIRLKYRYLDLRQPRMQHMLRTRARLVRALRSWLDGQGFQDIETPVLTRATPEGARDFLVPARLHPGFYAPAAEPAAVQADPDGGRLRPLLPDRPLLPR